MSASVLIIEDEEPIASTLKQLLTMRYEADVEIAQNVKEAKSLLDSNQYNFIIVDNFLPDGAGFKMICEMADKNRWIFDCNLIFLSGVHYVDKMPEFLEGVEKFSSLQVRNKPITAQTLFELVADTLPKRPSQKEDS